MALIQISDPGDSNEHADRRPKYAAGIDLGTTNSLAGIMLDGAVRILPDAQGRLSLPSAVRYRDDGAAEVGYSALDAAVSDAANTIVSAKRLIGRSTRDLQADGRHYPYRLLETDKPVVQIETVAGVKTPIEVSAEILKTLNKRACAALDCEALDGVVITVPAYFDDAQRQATKDAARFAGLNVLRLINEPTAAAVAYGLDRQSEGLIVVFDLGGGTFDVSVLRLEKGVFSVLATAGDTALGGDDFDQLIAEYVVRRRADAEGYQRDYTPQDWQALRRYAQQMKETLSDQETAQATIDLSGGNTWQANLSRAEMEDLIEDLVEKMLYICRNTVRDADVEVADVDEVVLVGGSTRLPIIQARVEAAFGRKPRADVDPDIVVAAGAALQADMLIGNAASNNVLLLDVTPLSLGIETMGGLVEKLIPRNTAIPAARAQEFTTYKDGQTSMSIHVVQGERELVEDCRSLAKFTLRGIPPMVAGAARIRVTFQVSADGLLTVEAQETTQGVAANVEVRPSYGLSDDDIELMLKDSLTHVEDDVRLRKLKEQQVAAKQVLESLSSALAQDADKLLDKVEYEAIVVAKQRLEAALVGEDADAIREKIRLLENCCENYVARRMNLSIRQAMQGRTVDEFQ